MSLCVSPLCYECPSKMTSSPPTNFWWIAPPSINGVDDTPLSWASLAVPERFSGGVWSPRRGVDWSPGSRRGHRVAFLWLDQHLMNVKSRYLWSSSMRKWACFSKKHRIKSSEHLTHGVVSHVEKKKKRKMLTPGIEPGLPKPQSGVLPLYYVSFLFYHFSTPFSLFHSSTLSPQIPFLLTKWLRGRSPRISLFCSKFPPPPPPLISPIIFI